MEAAVSLVSEPKKMLANVRRIAQARAIPAKIKIGKRMVTAIPPYTLRRFSTTPAKP